MSDTFSNHSRNMVITLTDGQQSNKNQIPAQQKVELTPEELVAWQTCMTGSRSIVPPILGAAIGYGLFRISPYSGYAKYAALISSVIGMMMGRIALSNMCLTKVASMPNSNLKERLIEAGYYGNRTPLRERLYYQGSQSLDVQSEVQSTAEPSTEIVFDDYPSMNKYDTYSSINDNSDLNVSEDTDLTEPISLQKGVSYDELRRKNRDEFYKKNMQWVAPRATPPVAKETTEQVPTSSNPSPMQAKTKYGDLWD